MQVASYRDDNRRAFDELLEHADAARLFLVLGGKLELELEV